MFKITHVSFFAILLYIFEFFASLDDNSDSVEQLRVLLASFDRQDLIKQSLCCRTFIFRGYLILAILVDKKKLAKI